MPVVVNFFIPAPTVEFIGVGKIAVGVDPVRDAEAGVNLQMRSKVTHPNGSVVKDIVVGYGMTVSRETLSGVMFAFPNDDAVTTVPFLIAGRSLARDWQLAPVRLSAGFLHIGRPAQARIATLPKCCAPARYLYASIA